MSNGSQANCSQEASKDLKSFLNEKSKQDINRPCKLPRIKDGNVADRSESRASHSAKPSDPPPEVPPPDSDASSPGCFSEGEASEDMEAADGSSEPGDHDLFAGKFAINDHEEGLGHMPGAHRMASLPRNVSKHLDQFEDQVLESIPKDISEPLVCQHSAETVHTLPKLVERATVKGTTWQNSSLCW